MDVTSIANDGGDGVMMSSVSCGGRENRVQLTVMREVASGQDDEVKTEEGAQRYRVGGCQTQGRVTLVTGCGSQMKGEREREKREKKRMKRRERKGRAQRWDGEGR